MQKIIFFYPVGDIINPITGGEIYDNHLYNELFSTKSFDVVINKCTNKKNIAKSLFAIIHKASKKDVIFFNSRICVYTLAPLIYNSIVKSCQIICIHHHFAYEEKKGLRRFLMKQIERVSLALCDKVISPNPYVIDCIHKVSKKSQIRYIGHPFEHSEKELSSYTKYKLLFVGTVYWRKGVDLLIEAIGQLPDIVKQKVFLNIVGNIDDIEYYTLLNTRIQQLNLGDNIHFSGRIDTEKLDLLYKDSYCFILPSRHEGYGLVIEEAMSYGLPVIAFNNSAMPYSIKNGGNGIIVEDGNTTELMKAIERIVIDPNLHSMLSKGARLSYSQSHDINDFKREVELLSLELSKS